MIYAFLFPLAGQGAFSFLNVVRYVSFRALAAALTALLLTFVFYPAFIRRLQARQIGQVVRSDGPASHLSKSGTPTMGGALLLFVVVLTTVLWARPENALVWIVLAATLGFGAIGFVDDALKLSRKSSGGLSFLQKLSAQCILGIAIGAFAYVSTEWLPEDWLLVRHRLALPFVAFERYPITLAPALYVAFAALVLVATSNAVNLTDGLDGLAIGPVMINAAVYLILAYLAGVTIFGNDVARYLDIPSIDSASELTIFAAALVGAGFGFLWYNTYPAQIFMGDVGSLALGGGLGALALTTKNEVLSIFLGGIFVIESVSVIGQVFSYRVFGKRILLMAPIHHHFEKKGWAEPKVIVRFWIVSIMLGIGALATLKLR